MELQVELKTLTPIWTGGVEAGKMDRIHETGIIGSLRWWYEAIVRGLGGKVCDTTADEASKRCIFEQKKGESIQEAYACLCPVCQLFGATGWRRRFRLVVADDQTHPIWSPENPINIRPPDRTNGWYLGAGRVGVFNLK
ncbi:MAG: type III-B CRISPR module RAMP protein Cmr1, partial [Chlorobiales bacterium]|nr:type III-B CRISPR module RAMP protein Cmr1 [Chlorobiales bacterium]